MPVNVFMLDARMVKHRNLSFYESDNILNYDVRRNFNPDKVKAYYEELGLLRPVMQSGSLWDSVKKGFNKVKNFFKKGMDVVDNSAVLKGLKDTALDFIDKKTGLNTHSIYDTVKNVTNQIPDFEVNTEPDPNTDPVAYYNYRQQQFNKNPTQSYYDGTNYNQYYGNTTYNPYYTNSYYGSPSNYANTNTYTTYSQPSTNNQSQNSFMNQLTSTSEQLNKMPLNSNQQSRVRRNLTALSSGLKSAGQDVKTALKMNKTIMSNIPKLLMMGKTATGSLTIKSDFKPILEKFGLKTLTVPKAIKDMVAKFNINIPEHDVLSVAKTSKGKCGQNDLRVNTSTSNNALSSTNNNSTIKASMNKDPAGRVDLGRGTKKTGKGDELATGSVKSSTGSVKSSRYADIIAKLKK